MKSVSPEKSLQERLFQFLNRVLIPHSIATLCSMKSMVYISFTTATISMIIPQDIVHGRPVPVFFRRRPMIYHIFLSFTLFVFLGSFSSLMFQHKPSVERDFRTYAVASMNSALGHRHPILVPYDIQGCKLFAEKAAKGLAKKKTHEGAKGGRGRERSISGGRDGKAIRDINRDPDPAPHIQKTGRPKAGFLYSQANGGVEGRDESWDRLEREKGSGGRGGGSIGGGQEEEAVANIKRDCHQTLHIERNRMSEVGFGVSQANGIVERRGGIPDECRDAEGEGSKSGANQAQDGEGEGSSSGESQGQDIGEGSASGENQGGDRNVGGSGSNDDEDERNRRQRDGGDIEQGGQENNLEVIDFSGIPQAFLAIIGTITVAALEFHNRGAISSTTLGRLIAIGVVGFLCCVASMLERDSKSMAARIFGIIGGAASGLEFLMLVSENFSSYYGRMILGLGLLAILLICVRAFRC